jgi:hypothetical protein
MKYVYNFNMCMCYAYLAVLLSHIPKFGFVVPEGAASRARHRLHAAENLTY